MPRASQPKRAPRPAPAFAPAPTSPRSSGMLAPPGFADYMASPGFLRGLEVREISPSSVPAYARTHAHDPPPLAASPHPS